ncbi:MAG: hypothetical protein R3B60_00550 [Candidatus Paceibacterota bacterium]
MNKIKFSASLYLSLITSVCLIFVTYIFLNSGPSCHSTDCYSYFLPQLGILTITSIPIMFSITSLYNFNKHNLIKKYQLGTIGIFGLLIILISLSWMAVDLNFNIINFFAFFIGVTFVTPYLLVRYVEK